MLKSLARTWIRTSVLRKGLSGDSKFWAFVGVLGIARQLMQRYGGREDTTLLSSPIRQGEVIELRYEGKPERSVRKERRKTAELARAYAAAAPGRQQRKMGRRFAGTVVPEVARRQFGSAVPGSLWKDTKRADVQRADVQRADVERAEGRRSRRSARATS